MEYLYVDNFRGFTDTLIPIKKVNFLVGENSTGKTSILSLLKLLSSPQFLRQYEFNTDQVEMGNFKNIVSMGSENRENFRIGFIVDRVLETGEKDAYLFLMTFTEENGLPSLSKFYYMDNEVECEFIFSEKSIDFWSGEVKNIDLSPVGIVERINNLGEKNDEKKLKTLTDFFHYERVQPFPISLLLMKLSELSRNYNSASSLGRNLALQRYGASMFLDPMIWIAPIRSKPRRTYDQYRFTYSPEGEHSPYLMKKLLTDRKTSKPFLKFIENFGIESNLLNSIEINPFGNDPASPFELMIRLNGKFVNIKYVGYGISQCLPLLVEMFSGVNGAWYAIQQPEVHLHPKAQAALGSLIFNLAISESKNFMVETHSDFIIDRFRLNCRRNKDKVDSQALYFERTPQGNTVYPIDIDEGGNYSENQPQSFRDFFVKEYMDLLALD